MARPRTALINKKEAVREALRMVDETPGDFSIRQLAKRLGVQTSSIYHHFGDRGNIRDAVCRLVLASIRPPANEKSCWDELYSFTIDYRAALVAHPNAVPLIYEAGSRRLNPGLYATVLSQIVSEGPSIEQAAALMSTLESLALGSATLATKRRKHPEDGDSDESAIVEQSIARDEEFEESFFKIAVESVIESFVRNHSASKKQGRRKARAK